MAWSRPRVVLVLLLTVMSAAGGWFHGRRSGGRVQAWVPVDDYNSIASVVPRSVWPMLTIKPSPTSPILAMPTPTAGPVHVRFGAQEAGRRAVSWFGGSPSARVLDVILVSARDLAVPPWRTQIDLEYRFDIQPGDPIHVFPDIGLNDPIYLVAISGVHPWVSWRDSFGPDPISDGPSQRLDLPVSVALVDPMTGDYLGYEQVAVVEWSRRRAILAQASRLRPVSRVAIGPPLPTSSATPASADEPPTAPPLPAGWPVIDALDAAGDLRPAFEAYPLTQGRRWVYEWRWLGNNGHDPWSASGWVTDTVVAARLARPDVAMAEVRREVSWRTTPLRYERWMDEAHIPRSGTSWHVVQADAVYSAETASIEALARGEAWSADRDLAVIRLPLVVGDAWGLPGGGQPPNEVDLWTIGGEGVEVVPAGPYEACARLGARPFNTMALKSTFCPGVGFVRDRVSIARSGGGSYEATLLSTDP